MNAPPRALLRAAPALFVILWSSGFIGAKFGLPYAEPFTFLLVRLLAVAGLLTVVALLAAAPWPRRRRDVGHIAVAGLLVHGAYLGGVFAAIHHGLSAGLVALIVGLQPLLTASVAPRLFGERVGPRQWAGLLLGLTGVGFVVSGKLGHGNEGDATAFAMAGIALAGITVGTLYQKRFCALMDLRTGAAIQYWATSILLLGLAASTETMHIDWTLPFTLALTWLVLALSVGAIFLLFMLIRHGQAARVASLFYLTPAVTAVMAWALFGESLPPVVVAGFVLSATGVALARKG